MSARENILAKLRLAAAVPMKEPETAAYYQEMTPHWESEAGRLKHWAAAMRAVKTEIHWVRAGNWPQMLVKVVQEKGLRNILLPLQTEHGRLAAAAAEAAGIEVKAFERPIEDWKDEFFADIDAGFTDAHCGIAHTGTLVLRPSESQPRSQSLVPPVHICLFDAVKMYNDFYSAMQGENMAAGMPTNVVLVSGPSKTADIQLTLAYGAHGPRDMVVLAVLPEHIAEADLAG
ncbi:MULTISPECIES: lactate utilization protein C [unclassified Neisseria]|uniref:LutC/YkgG family protein n=1 Tax=unclassified Neisseria TaxID=2623750 RepID=UPI001071C819|nr:MULTISPECIES: lactate utilization protein C [unclassified Neisseria]MBF0803869.1 lactate utilization protein C [Neisseria sp. 19428wB4_WF04]TFU43387.1 lactate utilization protein C [Neisseria sp. WF04]